MPKQQLIGDELDAETLQLLNQFGGRTRQTRDDDDIFDTGWLDEWVSEYLDG